MQKKQEKQSEVAFRLRQARAAAGYTREEAAANTGMTEKAILFFENNTRSIREAELVKLAVLYQCDPDWLACRDKTATDNTQHKSKNGKSLAIGDAIATLATEIAENWTNEQKIAVPAKPAEGVPVVITADELTRGLKAIFSIVRELTQ